MKFNITQSELQNALAIVSKGVSSRSTLPVLSGIHIHAQDDMVVFQSTNLELSIRYTAQALVEEVGDIVVPGKLFSDIIKSLPDAAVQVQSEGYESVKITCSSSRFMIKALNPDDFPAFPQVSIIKTVTLPFGLFTSMIKKVAKVVSKDESHMILTGVLIEIEGEIIRLVATDSYRLAVCQQELNNPITEDFSAVISGTFLNDIAALPKSEDNVKLSLSENQILISYQNTVFVNRRIEGDFPNYRRLLPKDYTTSAIFNKEELVNAVRRAALLGSTIAPVKFSINTDENSAVLSSSSQDIGSTQEELNCQTEGESIEIAFNSAFVLDGLNSSGSTNLVLETNSPFKPGIFKTPNTNEYTYLVMPVRIS